MRLQQRISQQQRFKSKNRKNQSSRILNKYLRVNFQVFSPTWGGEPGELKARWKCTFISLSTFEDSNKPFQLTSPVRTSVTIDHHIFRHIYLSRSLKNLFVSKYHQLLKSKISVYLQSYYYTSHDAFQKKSKKKLRTYPL